MGNTPEHKEALKVLKSCKEFLASVQPKVYMSRFGEIIVVSRTERLYVYQFQNSVVSVALAPEYHDLIYIGEL